MSSSWFDSMAVSPGMHKLFFWEPLTFGSCFPPLSDLASPCDSKAQHVKSLLSENPPILSCDMWFQKHKAFCLYRKLQRCNSRGVCVNIFLSFETTFVLRTCVKFCPADLFARWCICLRNHGLIVGYSNDFGDTEPAAKGTFRHSCESQKKLDFQVENQPRAAYIGSTHLRGDVPPGQCPSWKFLWAGGRG